MRLEPQNTALSPARRLRFCYDLSPRIALARSWAVARLQMPSNPILPDQLERPAATQSKIDPGEFPVRASCVFWVQETGRSIR